MIIIDEEADNKLIQALHSLTDREGKHCLRIHPVAGDAQRTRRIIMAQVRDYLPGTNLYFSASGHIYLLIRGASLKECKRAMLAIAAALRIQPAEHLGELYDLTLHTGTLLMLLEKKLELSRKTGEAAAQRQAQEHAAAAAARKRQEILEQGVRGNAEQIAAQRMQRSEPMLMIIEDDPFSRRLVENALQKQYALTGLDSAERALSLYADLSPDLLFLDINLPDVSGHELLERIIALDPQAYVVMLSSNADKANVMQAMQRGAVGFVAKPFSRDKLFQYIDRCPTIPKERVQ